MIKVELINTGSELLLGRTLNTHAQWIARRLSDLGYTIIRQVSVPDTGESIETAVRDALGRADMVVTTGGLGPTSDDLTRDKVARLLGRELVEDSDTLDRIERFFAQRKRPMPASTRVQALVPVGAEILANDFGTAPGLAIELFPNPMNAARSRGVLLMLPGPPRELCPMFDQRLLPWLREHMPLDTEWACRILRTAGLGESYLEELVAPPLREFVNRGLEIGYCAHVGQVDIRLSNQGAGSQRVVEEAVRVVRDVLGVWIFGEGDDSLEGVVLRELRERGLKLAISESCTGGLVANRMTNTAGASDVFGAGVVCYSNQAKTALLGVPKQLIEAHGAVSREVAASMAEGARNRLGADYGLALTGIAGPGGGTNEKPVGTLFLAVASDLGTRVAKRFNPYDRKTFKEVSSTQALDLLRREILGCGWDEKTP